MAWAGLCWREWDSRETGIGMEGTVCGGAWWDLQVGRARETVLASGEGGREVLSGDEDAVWEGRGCPRTQL